MQIPVIQSTYTEAAVRLLVETRFPDGVEPVVSLAAEVAPWATRDSAAMLAPEELRIRVAYPDVHDAAATDPELAMAADLLRLAILLVARDRLGALGQTDRAELAAAIRGVATLVEVG